MVLGAESKGIFFPFIYNVIDERLNIGAPTEAPKFRSDMRFDAHHMMEPGPIHVSQFIADVKEQSTSSAGGPRARNQ